MKLKNELNPQFKVFGVTRPGAGAERIMNSFAEDLQNLHARDCVILSAGANDVYKNNKRVALTQITKFIQRNYGTNIIILDIPWRHDLPNFSRVNSEIEDINRKLRKLASSYNHVSFLETSLGREYFTKHGLHWNSRGKTLVMRFLSAQTNKLVGKKPLTPINLIWRETAMSGKADSSNDETELLLSNIKVSTENTNRGTNEQRKPQKETSTDETILCRTSSRKRTVPVTRRDDFLW
jgi:hypothetical protein